MVCTSNLFALITTNGIADQMLICRHINSSKNHMSITAILKNICHILVMEKKYTLITVT